MIITTRPLVLIGNGRIARALCIQLQEQEKYLETRLHLSLPVAEVLCRTDIVHGEPRVGHLDLERLTHGLPAEQAETEALGEQSASQQRDAIARVADSFDNPAVVIDLTASDDTADLLRQALEEGHDVVLANKKPLCGSIESFEHMLYGTRGRIGYEATVGAGLPLIELIRGLVTAGDRLIEGLATLSGTLGYICTALEDQRLMSESIEAARRDGYTEPDPREDLSGADVRRKALILARTFGANVDIESIPVSPFFPLSDGSVDEWMRSLATRDQDGREVWNESRSNGMTWRYLASMTPEGSDVGLKEVPLQSSFGRLTGINNQVSLRTRYYSDSPILIQGPGAGPQVTAAGVLSDIVRLAR